MHTTTKRNIACGISALLLCLAPCFAASAADADDIAALKRAVAELQEENRTLAKRLLGLEAEKSERAAPKDSGGPPARAENREQERLAQRVKELELAKTAQEDAVRSIIRDSVSTLGSKINEAVSFSGQLGVTAARSKDFAGERKSSLGLTAVDLEFEVQVNEWALGHFKVEYIDGNDVSFITGTGQKIGVDRLSVDTAYITIGDAQRFPVSLSAGRMVLPFGISTGHPVADVLSTANPLTVEAFEMRANALGLNVAFPTPKLTPATPPVIAPPVRPLVLYPLLSSFGRNLGYDPPPTRLKAPTPLTLAPEPPPYTAGLLVYEGRTAGGIGRHVGATVGYRAKGHCGRPYDQLADKRFCPWAVNVDVNYNSSIFNSRFLETEYRGFLDQIDRVPGVAASVKASLGPFALVGEWNGATRQARFVDDLGTMVDIRPEAWQVSLGWQLGWNPWVEEIGAQGTYLAIGYSQSRDLAGVTKLIEGAPTRVGFVPKRRLLLTAGEWVVDGLRAVFEVSRDWDYSLIEGGSGNSANGVSATLTYVW